MAELNDNIRTFNEYDTIEVFNPMKEDFTVRFNGEPYLLKTGEVKLYPHFLAFHIAKHLSDKMLIPDLEKITKESGLNYNPKNGQLMIHDCLRRRETLYDILRSRDNVATCITVFPFKGFIGEMAEFDAYIAKQEEKKAKAEEKSAPKAKEEKGK